MQSYGLLVVFMGLLMFGVRADRDYGNIAGEWKASYGEEDLQELRVKAKTLNNLTVEIFDVTPSPEVEDFFFEVLVRSTKIGIINQIIGKKDLDLNGRWKGNVTLEALKMGYTEVFLLLKAEGREPESSPNEMKLVVVRDSALSNEVFTYTAGAVVLLMFVNLGTVLDLKRLKALILKPIGPLVGYTARYWLMPALALGLAKLCFPHNTSLQLALFFTALAPSGGLANICIVFLKGNINLSMATTTINSLMALAMMPFWIYVLGRTIFDNDSLEVPFVKLGISAGALVLAIAFGVLLRLLIPKTTRFIFRFLKPLSIVLSICLIGVTVGMNAFVFEEVTGMVILVAFCLPVLGYVLSFLLSKLLCRSTTDSLTIGVETSVLNMTVPIMLLQSCLEQPTVDLVSVIPITCALISLVMVLVFYMTRRILGLNKKLDEDAFDEAALIADLEFSNRDNSPSL